MLTDDVGSIVDLRLEIHEEHVFEIAQPLRFRHLTKRPKLFVKRFVYLFLNIICHSNLPPIFNVIFYDKANVRYHQ